MGDAVLERSAVAMGLRGGQMTAIHGFVVDAAGHGIERAIVSIADGPGAWPDIAAVTDRTGRFCLRAPEAGTYHLVASADRLPSTRIELELDTEVSELFVTVELDTD